MILHVFVTCIVTSMFDYMIMTLIKKCPFMELCDIYDIPFLLQALRVLRVRQPGDNTDSPHPTTYLNNQVKAGQRSTTEVKVRGVEKNQGQLMNVTDTFLSRDCS